MTAKNISNNKTGDLFSKETKENNCTLKKPLEIVIREIRGPYTELDRKLWNVLMYMACDSLENYSLKAKYHSIDEHKLLQLFSEYSGIKDLEHIWKSLKRLAATTVDIEIEDENKRITEATNLVNARIIENKKDRTGKIEYLFPPAIANLAKDPLRFTRVKMHFMLGLKGKYSVTLYELLESKINMNLDFYEWDLSHLRNLMRVPPNKLTRWVDLKRFAIDPFVKEINNDPHKSGFNVQYEAIVGTKRKIVALKFYVEKHSTRKQFEKRMVKHVDADSIPFQAETRTYTFTPAFFENIKNEMQGVDVYSMKAEWENSISKLKEPITNPEGHFRNFCRKVSRKQMVKTIDTQNVPTAQRSQVAQSVPTAQRSRVAQSVLDSLKAHLEC